MKSCSFENCTRKYYAKKLCQYHYNRQWVKANPEKRSDQSKRYRERNPGENKAWFDAHPGYKKEANKKYYEGHKDECRGRMKTYREKPGNKERRNELRRRRHKNDPLFAAKRTLRSLFNKAFKLYSANGKIMSSKKYGIDYVAIFEHIGPCPGNRDEYHIDHIKPLCSFNFDDPIQVKMAFAPENHQWLVAEENLSKGGKY